MSEGEHREVLFQISARLATNLIRVAELQSCATKLLDDENVPESCIGEILRTTVVFMHAILEDTIREIARLKLSESSTEVLDTIPLVGTSSSGHPRKFSLGMLSKHRNRTVEELIRESVGEYLDRMGFSSATEIARILEQMKIDPSGLRKYFAPIDEAITRRHQIVHKADMDDEKVKWKLNPIHPLDVRRWSLAMGMFTMDLLNRVTDTDMSKLESENPELRELMEKLRGLAKEAGVL